MPKSAIYGKGRQGEAIDFNMTPMIDVTFQLIIFFILAGQMASQELAQLLLYRPFESQAVRPEDMPSAEEGQVVINVVSQARDAEDPKNVDPMLASRPKEYRVGKESIAGTAENNKEQFDRLVQVLKERVGTRDPTKIIVEIRSDRRVDFRGVRPAMMAAAEAGFLKMNITAKVKFD